MTLRTRVVALAATLPLLLGVAACAGTPAAEQPLQPTKPVAPLKAAPPMRLTSATFAPTLNRATAKVTSFRAVGQVMLASADPTKQFKSWKAGGQKVKFIDADKLGDRAVEHYQVSVNVAKKPIVFDMWLGADKLLYKMAYTFLGMDCVMTMTGYNTVAPITAPPASKIVKQR